MRINDEQEYEAALEEAISLMDAPGARGGEDERLQTLIAAIDGYRPTFTADSEPGQSSLSERATQLVRQAADLKARFDADRRKGWEGFPDDGEGIGPTTGV